MPSKPKHVTREWTVGEYKGIYQDSITHVYLNGEIVIEYNYPHKRFTYVKQGLDIPAYVITELKSAI